jgi:hypothetical protein
MMLSLVLLFVCLLESRREEEEEGWRRRGVVVVWSRARRSAFRVASSPPPPPPLPLYSSAVGSTGTAFWMMTRCRWSIKEESSEGEEGRTVKALSNSVWVFCLESRVCVQQGVVLG